MAEQQATTVSSTHKLVVKNIGLMLSGDIERPILEADTLIAIGGRIAAVGANAAIPVGARVIDGAGKIVTPGLIESGVQTGIVEIPLSADGTADERTTDARVSAAFTIVDAFNGNSTLIPVTRVDGITRVLVTPAGTGNVFLGQGAVMDLTGAQVPAMLFYHFHESYHVGQLGYVRTWLSKSPLVKPRSEATPG